MRSNVSEKARKTLNHMNKRIWKVALVVMLILLAIFVIRAIKETNRGTPNQSEKGNPL